MIKLLKSFLLFLFAFVLGIHFSNAQNNYQAHYAKVAPTIDGDTNDVIWSNTSTWYTYNQVWLNNVGSTPTPQDFSWKYKLAWREDRFYILAVITDDVLSDRVASPLDRYYEDDTFEVFFDEDNSGGMHERSFQAFAYHVSLTYDIVDSDQNGTARLLNDHANVRMKNVNGKYVWEAAFKVYPSTFTLANPGLPVTLFAGKKLGWGLAYCDNDGRSQRDHFFGSETVEGTNKNIAYQNADVFGTVELVNTEVAPVPAFSHVLVDNGLTKPTAMRIAPNGDIYVCEQGGKLKILQNGELQSGNLVSLNANTEGPSNTERGLLGLALDPDFESNHYIYLYYTTAQGYIHNRVSRFTLNGTAAVTNTEVIISELDTLSTAAIHNGGAMHFGLDGKLYIAAGENSTPSNSQDLGTTHGKLLRINKDGTIPQDNPYAKKLGADPRIWSAGWRNPFTFDVSAKGQILVNDVGFETMQEIDDATKGGQNYGWPLEEGLVPNAQFTKPIYTYKRVTATGNTDSTGCAITGGVFFEPRTTNYPQEYVGKYFFMDYCSKWINYIDPATGKGRKTFANNVAQYPIAIDYHPDGNLYYLARGNSSVYKITYSGKPLPVITRQPEIINVTIGTMLKIPVTVSGEEPMTYTWKKNGVVITATNSSTFQITNVLYADSGMYTLTITNVHGTGETKPVKVRVLEYNAPPVVTIKSLMGESYYGGQTFKIVGRATDPEEGVLPSSTFTWSVDLHHATHIHDGLPSGGKDTLTMSFETEGSHSEADIFYRITLIARDSKGLSDTAYVDIYPQIVEVTINSDPSGLKFTLDGTPYTTPYTFQTVKGVERTVGAFGPQTSQGIAYGFDKWEHSSDSINEIHPMQNGTYIVLYKTLILTGLDELQNSTFHVYPNPFSETFTLDAPEDGKLTVMDAQGNVVEMTAIHAGKNKLDLNLSKGIYQLILQHAGKQSFTKLIKK